MHFYFFWVDLEGVSKELAAKAILLVCSVERHCLMFVAGNPLRCGGMMELTPPHRPSHTG